MGIRRLRWSGAEPLVSIAYFISRIFNFLPVRGRLKLLLDFEWIMSRLAHELSFEYYAPEAHPIRLITSNFLISEIDSSLTVLDLGCSTGINSFLLSKVAEKVVGVDHDEHAIAQAQRKYQRANLTYIFGDALAFLKTNQMKFDVLILSHVLEHLDNPAEFLDSISGKFEKIYIEVPDFESSFLQKYRSDIAASLIYTDSDHVSEFDRCELEAIFKKCGLTVLRENHRYGYLRFWCKA